MIRFNNKASDEFNLYVEQTPNYIIPKKKSKTISVPGRNGDLIITENSYENYIQPYEIYISAVKEELPNVAKAVAAWFSVHGYKRLEDEYEPDVYRMAEFVSPLEIENYLNEYGKATIEFNCMPQKFLKDGEWELNINNGQKLFNSTFFNARPLITVRAYGAGKIKINDIEIALLSAPPSGKIILDCDIENAYCNSLDMNNIISAPMFFELVPGENTVSWSGGISSITIVPRWWRQ